MTLRAKFAFWFAAIVAAVLTAVFVFIYETSADFREDEFYLRLKQRALTTRRYLVEVNEIDTNLLKIIDRNSLSSMMNEQVLIFDRNFRLLYGSDDRRPWHIDTAFLQKTVRDGEARLRLADRTEVLGICTVSGDGGGHIVLASALDQFGISKLRNLLNSLYAAWLIGVALAVGLAYFYVRNIVGRPLQRLTGQVSRLTAVDLKSRLSVPAKQDELTVLAASFNELLDRLDRSLNAQRTFVQFASHELRTPLAVMLSETENALAKERDPLFYEKILVSLREEQGKLIQLTNSLLLLANPEAARPDRLSPVRVDEALYQTIDDLRAANPSFRVQVDFESVPGDEAELSVAGYAPLLCMAFRNLLENACRYSPDRSAVVRISPGPAGPSLHFENAGAALAEEEAGQLFTPFFRGGNAAGKAGSGLGLVIAKHILDLHGLGIGYAPRGAGGGNRFTVGARAIKN